LVHSTPLQIAGELAAIAPTFLPTSTGFAAGELGLAMIGGTGFVLRDVPLASRNATIVGAGATRGGNLKFAAVHS
jgi:hypothetical protein